MNEPNDSTSLVYMLGQIDAKVTHLLAGQTLTNERLEKHDERITRVERGHWKIAGIASIVPVLLTGAGLVIAFFKGG